MDLPDLKALLDAVAPNNRASRSKKNNSISGPDDTSASDTTSKKAKAEEKRQREEYEPSYVRLPNGQNMELPLKEDFHGPGALPQKRYWERLRQTQEQVNIENPQVIPKNLKAPAPCVLDPTTEDISTYQYGCEDKVYTGNGRFWFNGRPSKRVCRRSNVSSRVPLSQEFIDSEDESDEEELPEHIIRKTPPTFMGIPREIRMKIYRYLLLNKKEITVHEGWKQVHRNNQLSLPMSILRTCKIVHDEACVVLYGENVFVYLLRDPIFPTLHNLATNDDEPPSDEPPNDEPPSDDESDSGSEYEDEEEDSLSYKDDGERCIDVDKYAHLFRKIVVEAEHNRYSKATQQSMAAAIRLFASRNDACNIHTLTVRVSPLWNEERDGLGTGSFTFIDFFEPRAPVIRAIKALDCQMLHVEILTKYMSRQSSNYTISHDGSVRLTVDRCWQRYQNMVRQGRAHQGGFDERDKVMIHRMRELPNKASVAIDELAKSVEEQCNERNFHQNTTMGLAVNWPNINSDDFEDMEH